MVASSRILCDRYRKHLNCWKKIIYSLSSNKKMPQFNVQDDITTHLNSSVYFSVRMAENTNMWFSLLIPRKTVFGKLIYQEIIIWTTFWTEWPEMKRMEFSPKTEAFFFQFFPPKQKHLRLISKKVLYFETLLKWTNIIQSTFLNTDTWIQSYREGLKHPPASAGHMRSSPGPAKAHILQGKQAWAPQLTLRWEVHPGELGKAHV